MAANSTKLLTDIQSVITNGPSTTTKSNALSQAGAIMDYVGNTKLVQGKFVQTAILLDAVITGTDAGDGSLTLLQGVKALMRGTSSPSTTAIADMKTVATNGPTALTKAKAAAQAGPLMDYVGNVRAILRGLEESAVLIGYNSQATGSARGLLSVTDTGTDGTNKNLLLGMSQVLV